MGPLLPPRGPVLASSLALSAVLACALPGSGEFSAGVQPDATPATTTIDGTPAPSAAGGGEAGAKVPPAVDGGSDAASVYAAMVLGDRPLAYYRFEDAPNANAAKDELGKHPAVTSGPIGFGAPGVAGKAVAFNGSQVLDVGDTFDFAGKVPFAYELWVKANPRSDNNQLLFFKRLEGVDPMIGYLLYLQTDGSAHFEGWGVQMSAWTDTPIPTSFTHVVLSVSYAGGVGNATLWINGQKAPHGGYDNTDDLADTPVALRFGIDLVGTLDELAIYDHDLPFDRVAAHYAAGQQALR